MKTLEFKELTIEKVSGGYLIFSQCPQEDYRFYIGFFSTEDMKELMFKLNNFIKK